MWNTRIVSNIDSVDLSGELYLNSKMYNIPSEVGDEYMGRNRIS